MAEFPTPTSLGFASVSRVPDLVLYVRIVTIWVCEILW